MAVVGRVSDMGAGQFFKKLLGHVKKFAPRLIEEFAPGGELVADLVRSVTGKSDLEEASQAVLADPTLLLELEKLAVERQRIVIEGRVARIKEMTARLQSINETMRAEMQTDDNFRGRWRPYWGYVSGTAWGVTALAFAIVIVLAGAGVDGAAEALPAIAQGFADMSVFWGVALAVLGVAVWSRGEEKKKRVSTEQFKSESLRKLLDG